MEFTTSPTEFKIFTGLLKASRSPDGDMRLHGVASSTTKDLHGDTMMATAIDDMEQAANRNLTIFLNHSYNVPEDVGGSVEKARSYTRGVDHEGNPNYDLDFDIKINAANDRAVKTWEAIDRGTKLGLSIGAMIPEGGARRNKDGSYLIDHVDLLETSIVGIPANPRSWVEYAVKAIKAKGKGERTATVPLGTPTLTLTNNDYTITGTLENSNIVFDSVQPEVAEQLSEEPEVADDAPELGVTDSADPEPDVQDAQVTIIQIDTSDGDSPAAADDAPASSQEAPPSDPESGDGLADETADGDDAALGDDLTRAVEPDLHRTLFETLSLLRETTRELIEAKTALSAAQTAAEKAATDRDAMQAERDHVLRSTKDILDRVADTPLARRAVVRDAQHEFRTRFGGVYSETFLDMLEKTHE
jgi:HK97 family phage prohead protease